MANKYVYSGAGGGATGADWANAYLTLAAALTGAAAGDDIWVANDHSETQASTMTLTSPGTAASPCRIHCVARAGSVPPVNADLATTALVVTTGAFGINFLGFAYCHGITFRCGTGGTAASIGFDAATSLGWHLKSCRLELVNTGSSGRINVGSSTASIANLNVWLDTIVKFGAVGQSVALTLGTFMWRGGSVDAAGSIPTTAIISGTRAAGCLIEGVDFSALGSGKTIMGAVFTGMEYKFKDCKLGASVTKATTPSGPGPRVFFSRCDSADTNTTDEVFSFYGTQTVETTIVRTGGASDGTTTIAEKIVTTADAKFLNPFRSKPIVFWNESTSAQTITLQGIWGGGAVPTNADIWLEVEYSTDASFPTGGYLTDGKASNLATAANQTAGSGTWGGSTTKFSLDVTITAANKGPISLVVCCGAASSTFYIDPKPVIS